MSVQEGSVLIIDLQILMYILTHIEAVPFQYSVLRCIDAYHCRGDGRVSCLPPPPPGLCHTDALASAGVTAECPPSAPMVDGTECQEHGGRCRAGKCVPFCELNGLHSCMCDVEKYACNLCCRKSLNDTCTAQEPLRTLSGGTPCMHGLCTNTVSGGGRGDWGGGRDCHWRHGGGKKW